MQILALNSSWIALPIIILADWFQCIHIWCSGLWFPWLPVHPSINSVLHTTSATYSHTYTWILSIEFSLSISLPLFLPPSPDEYLLLSAAYSCVQLCFCHLHFPLKTLILISWVNRNKKKQHSSMAWTPLLTHIITACTPAVFPSSLWVCCPCS